MADTYAWEWADFTVGVKREKKSFSGDCAVTPLRLAANWIFQDLLSAFQLYTFMCFVSFSVESLSSVNLGRKSCFSFSTIACKA